jgi:ankyrin repeat protein
VDLNCVDFYKLNVSHYAARTGKSAILVYLKDVTNIDTVDCYGYTPLHYSVMYAKVYTFILLYFKYNHRFNPMTL